MQVITDLAYETACNNGPTFTWLTGIICSPLSGGLPAPPLPLLLLAPLLLLVPLLLLAPLPAPCSDLLVAVALEAFLAGGLGGPETCKQII